MRCFVSYCSTSCVKQSDFVSGYGAHLKTYVFGNGTRLPQSQLGVWVDNDRNTAVGVDAGELGLLDLVERDVLNGVGQAELLKNLDDLAGELGRSLWPVAIACLLLLTFHGLNASPMRLSVSLPVGNKMWLVATRTRDVECDRLHLLNFLSETE